MLIGNGTCTGCIGVLTIRSSLQARVLNPDFFFYSAKIVKERWKVVLGQPSITPMRTGRLLVCGLLMNYDLVRCSLLLRFTLSFVTITVKYEASSLS